MVQACPAPGRPGFERVRSSIEASDIGKNYQLLFQPPELTIREHFIASLRAGRATGADLVLRLEDDIEVNRHIVYNVATWSAPGDARFGLGWIFDPGGMTRSTVERRYKQMPTQDRWLNILLAYAQAVVMRASDVEEFCERCQGWFAKHQNSPCEQDLALSQSVLDMRKWICVHAPSLVEHVTELPSQLGHNHGSERATTSAGTFAPTWRRGDPVLDRFGREITPRG